MTWFYRRLGSLYPAAFLTVELLSALLVTAGTVGLATFYYDADGGQFLKVMVIALGMTALAIAYELVRAYRRVRPIQAWIGGARGPEETARAWSAAVGLPLTILRRDLPLPVLFAVLTSCAAGVAVLELPWTAFFPFLAFSAVAVG